MPFLKDALWGGGGYPPELKGLDSRKRGQGRVGLAVGSKHFGSGKVGGRDTGPKDGANFATCRIFCCLKRVQKEEKWRFLKDARVQLAWWTGW